MTARMETGNERRSRAVAARRRAGSRAMTLAFLLPALVLGLAACAPEPGTGVDPASPGVDAGGTGDEGNGGETSPQDDPALKQQELPADFPSDAFALPDDAVIDDVGSREPGSWYLVLRAQDAPQADDWWTQITGSSGFDVRDQEETEDGGHSATLVNSSLNVQALTIPQSDGSVLLSYDLGPATG